MVYKMVVPGSCRLRTGLLGRMFLATGLVVPFTAVAQDIAVIANLSTPLSGAASRKGDLIAAQVTSPDALRGDSLQGVISQANSRGQASVTFTFNTLRHGNLNIPITATIQGVSNASGQPGIDDRGQALRAVNTAGSKPVSASRIGGQLGGLLGGRSGQAVSDVGSDVNTSGSAGAMQITAASSSLELGTGSSITLSARTNGNGPGLASLPPNAPVAASVPAAAAPPPQMAAAAPRPATAAPPSAAAAPPAAADTGAQPELKSTKIEFVPGEKTIFYDDFSDMVEDEPPPHWKVRNGKVELRTGGNIHELYAADSVSLTSPSIDIPVNFTFELDWTGKGEMQFHFRNKEGVDRINATVRGEPDGQQANISVNGPDGGLGGGGIKVDTSKPVHFALWTQQGRVRLYLNGERIVDANQVQVPVMGSVNFTMSGYRPNGVRLIRIAESAPDFSTVINSTGKYVTHGINFDTDSDRLKPDSAAVLKLVAAALNKNPNLKLEVDGYTDSVGKVDHNLDLSKRRAEAVKTVLVSQFGIDGDRLSSNGFGADNPIGSNDTPDGRTGNRRVEFLKK